ncbi:MFS transporter [Roseovarius faecimaris]|uniref:MFS transporter n=1 Tax=Roseovarius faecimaris TaxID=2494550 RepID=A0A6I6IPG5_9RHOB|nr:MFS transporter [Roseovarius faecimaris]QGX97347.1 MFS transporter [Roseovarius faecimaris]
MTPSFSGLPVLVATALVAMVLGTVHAYSVFLVPLEVQFGTGRSALSLGYSLALVCLTLVVLAGPRLYARAAPATLMILACGGAATGALLAGWGGSLALLYLGYGVIFGAANGLGYGFGLQLAAQANPGREGLAMGVVTAAYALGAVLAPGVFEAALVRTGFGGAMTVLALALIGAGGVSVLLLRRSGIRFQTGAAPAAGTRNTGLPLLWLGYFGGVLAGLMVIGHAAGIAEAMHPGQAGWMAPAIIALCNLAGSLAGGRLADGTGPRRVLVGLVLLTGVTLAALALGPRGGGVFLALGLVGFAYGGTIAATPAVIAKLYGMGQSAAIYGRVFTAWGAAGLAGPWLAGALYDWRGGYGLALMLASGFALVAALSLAAFKPPDRAP